MKLLDIEIAWAAGFFEGEGTIRCWIASNSKCIKEPGRKYAYLQASAHQLEREPPDRLQSVLGGKVYGPYLNNHGATYFKWFANSKVAEGAMALIEPHLSSRRLAQLVKARSEVAVIQDRIPLRTGPAKAAAAR